MTADQAFLEGLQAGFRLVETERQVEAMRAFPKEYQRGFDVGFEMREDGIPDALVGVAR